MIIKINVLENVQYAQGHTTYSYFWLTLSMRSGLLKGAWSL
jgi:hypothetical protein